MSVKLSEYDDVAKAMDEKAKDEFEKERQAKQQSEMLLKVEEMKQKYPEWFKQADPQNQFAPPVLFPCPSCGYCPTCGRRRDHWPSYPTYPWTNPWITYTTGTGCSHA